MVHASVMPDILEVLVRSRYAHQDAQVMEPVRKMEHAYATRTLRAQIVPYLLIVTGEEDVFVDFATVKRDTKEKNARLICVQTAESIRMEITPSRYRFAQAMVSVLH
mmetsp:Transcript_26724/g.61031  ORF Transcript_26724/g.61031 Transcript_26724/m.61031 type:complete len:107 (-) Transcript_26724:527-847(-)